MAIRYISYTKQQQSGMEISAYSLYVNGSYWQMYESVASATDEAGRYARFNDVEIYPVLTRRY